MNVNLVFAMIFAIIIMGAVLMFAFTNILDVFSLAKESAFEKQIDEFRNSIDDVFSLSYGSRETFEFRIGDNERVCFLSIDDNTIWENDPIMREFVESGNNLIVMNEEIKAYNIERMKVSQNFCIDGSETLLLINTGKYVDVKVA